MSQSNSEKTAIEYYERGLAYGNEYKLEEAIIVFTKAIEIFPAFADAYCSRGWFYYLMQGNTEQALPDLNEAIRINPVFSNAYFLRGSVRMQENRDLAISDFTKAIENRSDYIYAYFWRGCLHNENGSYDQAIADFTKVIENDTHNLSAGAYRQRGFAHCEQGNLDHAITDYTKTIELNPSFDKAYYLRGVAYYYKKDYDKSWEDIHKAGELGYRRHPEFIEDLKKASGREK